MRSIKRTLLAWILGALALGSVLVILVMYLVTLEELNEALDANLQDVAESVASYQPAWTVPAADSVPPRLPHTSVPDDTSIVTLTWTRDGRRIHASDPRVKLPFASVEGLSHPTVDGQAWIVYSSVSDAGVAQAAQRVISRREMAGVSAAKVFTPMLLLVVVVGGLLVFGLRRGLQPLDAAARDIAARSETALDPVDTGDVPREIAPLVASINGLIVRVSSALAAQRRFLADAAHELRTPVTALRLQLQLLRRSSDEASREEAMRELEAGIARSQRLIEQLLLVARTDPEGMRMRREAVDLGTLVREVVGSMSLKAEQAGIDIGAGGAASIVVPGDAEQLTVLLDNLVENALRYAPSGSLVDVEADLRGSQPELRVIDNGPGIDESERIRVFDRFYRTANAAGAARDRSGSGLGLAIVRTIAERHGAQVSLHTAHGGQGLEVRVLFAAPGPVR